MGLEAWGLPSAEYDMTEPRGVMALLLAMVLVGLCVYVAARAVLRKNDLYQALAAGALGLLCAHLAYVLTAGKVDIVGLVLGLAAFSLVTAGIYRTKPAQGLVVGAVAWVFWILVNIGIGYVQDHWH